MAREGDKKSNKYHGDVECVETSDIPYMRLNRQLPADEEILISRANGIIQAFCLYIKLLCPNRLVGEYGRIYS